MKYWRVSDLMTTMKLWEGIFKEMKNSQYANHFNINISEMARLIFAEQLPQNNNEIEHVAAISIHVGFLKEVHRTIGEAIASHEELIRNQVIDNPEIN